MSIQLNAIIFPLQKYIVLGNMINM